MKVRKVSWAKGYFVSRCGRVFSTRQNKWHELKPGRHNKGYLVVSLTPPGGRMKTVGVHTLVMEAWGPPRPGPNYEVCHFPDRDPANNRITNLRWGTRKDNSHDREFHGTVPRGEDHKGSVLKEHQVREARRLSRRCGGTLTDKELAARYGCGEDTVRDVLLGRTWAHIQDKEVKVGVFKVGMGRPLTRLIVWRD